jgi:Ulp1 family protease
VFYLDSAENQEKVSDNIMRWVFQRQIFENEKTTPFKLEKPPVAQQNDRYSCGIYLITFMEYAISAINSEADLTSIWSHYPYIYILTLRTFPFSKDNRSFSV